MGSFVRIVIAALGAGMIAGLVAGVSAQEGDRGRSFSPESFLRRMDRNENGVLEPEEMEGRARFFLERMARDNPELDLSRPIPIDRLAEQMQRSRGSGDSERGRFGRREDDDRDGGPSDRSRSSGPVSLPPLVPGFGIELELAPVPGFGQAGELAEVPVTPEDRREAQERFDRFDENRDGYLDREELGRGRWRDDPLTFDQNHDGRLTVSELAVRYAQQRSNEQPSGGEQRAGQRPGNEQAAAGPGGRGGFAPDSRMLDGLFQRYDRNGSGVLERDEWSGFRSDPSAADTNRDSRISREEMSQWMASRMQRFQGPREGDQERGRGGFGGGGFGGGGFGGGGGWGGGGDERGRGSWRGDRDDDEAAEVRRDSNDADADRKSYRFLAPTERLPSDIPDWFTRGDRNTDGQLAMSEYASSWNEDLLREFAQFDQNRDGFITAEECLAAERNGVRRGAASRSSSSTARSDSSTRPATPPRSPAPATAGSSASASPSTRRGSSAPSGEVDPRYLRYAEGRVRQFDRNQDGALDQDEWNAMPTNPSAADADSDGRITPEELARWTSARS